jgi:hypothetical protein
VIGVGLDARLGLPFGELREVAREAERLGFESLWTPAGGVPDAFHVCAAWSGDTSLRTGISVVPAARMWTHHWRWRYRRRRWLSCRRAFGAQVLSYAMGRPGIPLEAGYRGLFAQLGFDGALRELEARRDGGAALAELVDAAPDELFHAVGYFGPAAGAPAAFARLSAGLDETIVRVITARPGPEPVIAAMAALTPAAIRAVGRA